MHAIGIDASIFNTMSRNLSLSNVHLIDLTTATMLVTNCIASNIGGQKACAVEEDLLAELNAINLDLFPLPKFRFRVRGGEIDERGYSANNACEFNFRFCNLLESHQVSNEIGIVSDNFMNSWYLQSVDSEIEGAKRLIEGYSDVLPRDVLRLVQCRAARYAHAASHYDLATLIKPVTEPYY